MRSMTGYGHAEGENRRHAVAVSLKGVNHRYLDLRLRLDDEYREAEDELRALLQGRIFRGRVEAVVEVRRRGEPEVSVEVHRGVVLAAHTVFHELLEEGLVARELTAGDLVRLPEAVRVQVEPDSWDVEDRRLLREVASRALADLVEARRSEGRRLSAVLEERLGELEACVSELAELRVEALEETAGALEERLAALLEHHGEGSAQLDPGRLAQEVAILADKSDVAEELDRLGSHLGHFREVMEEAAGPASVGKRLDFLCQEILREINTLGAKARSAPMTRKVLDAKGWVEQLREQVQNVE